MLLQIMIFLLVPIPCKGLEKTQFDIFRYYKIAYSRDKVFLVVRSDYNRELYSSKFPFTTVDHNPNRKTAYCCRGVRYALNTANFW